MKDVIEEAIDGLVESDFRSNVHKTESGEWYVENGVIYFDNSGYKQQFTRSQWQRLLAGETVKCFKLQEPGIISSTDEEHWFDTDEVNLLFGIE